MEKIEQKRPDELYGFKIDWVKREIWTNCGDSYFDYRLTFVELAQLAKYIEKGMEDENERSENDGQ